MSVWLDGMEWKEMKSTSEWNLEFVFDQTDHDIKGDMFADVKVGVCFRGLSYCVVRNRCNLATLF